MTLFVRNYGASGHALIARHNFSFEPVDLYRSNQHLASVEFDPATHRRYCLLARRCVGARSRAALGDLVRLVYDDRTGEDVSWGAS